MSKAEYRKLKRNKERIDEVFTPSETEHNPYKKIDELFEYFKNNEDMKKITIKMLHDTTLEKISDTMKHTASNIVNEIIDGYEISGSIEIFKQDIEKLNKILEYIEKIITRTTAVSS